MQNKEELFFKRTVTNTLKSLDTRRPIEATDLVTCVEGPFAFMGLEVFYVCDEWGFALVSPTGLSSLCLAMALCELFHYEDYFEACEGACSSPMRPSKLN